MFVKLIHVFLSAPYSEVLFKYMRYCGFVNQVFVCECLRVSACAFT